MSDNINLMLSQNCNYIDPLQVINKNVFESIQDAAICAICTGVVIDARQCDKCENCFCKICIEKWNVKSNSCPFKCSDYLIRDPSRVIKQILSKIVLMCPKHCNTQLFYNEFLPHLKECTNQIIDCPTCGSKISESAIIRPSYIDLQIENRILKRKIDELDEKLANNKRQNEGYNFEKEFEDLNLNFSHANNNSNIKKTFYPNRKKSKQNSNYNHENCKFMYKFSCCKKDFDCINCHNANETHRASDPIAIICQDCLFASRRIDDKICKNCGVSLQDNNKNAVNSLEVNYIKYRNSNKKNKNLLSTNSNLNNIEDANSANIGISHANKKSYISKFVRKNK